MSLVDDLKQRHPNQGPSGRTRVLQFRAEIEEALEAGFSRRQIWDLLRGRGQMPVTYPVFNSYLRDLNIGSSLTPDFSAPAAVPAPPVTPEVQGAPPLVAPSDTSDEAAKPTSKSKTPWDPHARNRKLI